MKTLLVVDDNTLILTTISNFIAHLHGSFSVLTAENGEEAVKVLNTKKVDLVLTDINMPVMDGYGLLAYISENQPDIQAIAMTAVKNREVTKKLDFFGVRNVFQKPFDLNDLSQEILHLLDNNTGKPEPAHFAQQAIH